MADSAVGYLLNKLDALTQEQVHLLRAVDEGIHDIRLELQQMTAFLRAADTNPDPDEQLKVWVNHVRDVSYDTEDVLDEYLRLCFKHGGTIFDEALHLFRNLKARHQLAVDIERIKSRVIKISECRQRYPYNNPPFYDQGSRHNFAPDSHMRHDPRRDVLLKPEEDLVGIDKPRAELLQLLRDGGSGLKVVSIVGMGGLGKTTLAKRVYDEVKMHFNAHAEISVSQSFSMKELSRNVIHEVYEEMMRPMPQEVELMNEDRVKKFVQNLLQPKRYLILVDDVWDMNAWNALKIILPDNDHGSRILLTTRKTDLATSTAKGAFYKLSPLSSKDSWNLFCQKTFWGSPCPSHLETVSQSIVKRCGGLPLAIVAISGILATRYTSNVDEWEKIDRSIGAEMECNDELQTMTRVLSLSYSDLPYYLKNCFLYMSAFPEDHFINRMRLIRLWVAEGFVLKRPNLTLEEVADSYLNELLSRNLIQEEAKTTFDGRLPAVCIHDILREIAIEKSKYHEFLVVANRETTSTAWPMKIRRLSVQGNRRHDLHLKKSLSKLRTLLVFGEDFGSVLSHKQLLSGNCRLLRVLDLRGSPIDKFPIEIVELYHLRYLSLRNTRVKVVPNSIEKLHNLETLDLKNTLVREFPIGILKLQNLHHLFISEAVPCGLIRGFKTPIRIGALQFLQTLCYIEMTDEATGTSREIGRLTQLRKLGIVEHRRRDGNALCSALDQLSNLRSLAVVTAQRGEEAIDLENVTSPPQYLQRLYLWGSLNNNRLPQWISCLQALAVLRLRLTELRDDPLESLQALPTLRVLLFENGYMGETLGLKAGGFQRLKLLILYKLEGLKRVEIEMGSTPSLGDFRIVSCQLLKEAPVGIQHL